MSLAGGSSSNFGCSSVDSGVLCSSSNAPSSGMPNVVDRHCMQRNSDLSAQKWLKGCEKAPNNGKEVKFLITFCLSNYEKRWKFFEHLVFTYVWLSNF